MRILITGGAGFIGSHLAEHYQDRAEVRVLDNFRTGYQKNLAGLKVELIEGSILDRALVDRAVEGCDYVFHLAALVSVAESMIAIRECVDLNVGGFLNVLEASARAGVGKVVLASSAAIYGDNPEVPKRETMIPEPKSPYAITKLDGEYYAGMFAREERVATACARFFNVFGPRQDPKGAYAAAVPIFIEKALKGEALTIYGDGEQTRDFIYVKDIVGALAFLAERDVDGVYNVGYGGSMTVQSLAEKILQLTDSKASIIHAPERPGDVKHSRASSDKLRAAGWSPAFSLEEGLRASVSFFGS